jgi:hypothetical protein
MCGILDSTLYRAAFHACFLLEYTLIADVSTAGRNSAAIRSLRGFCFCVFKNFTVILQKVLTKAQKPMNI